MYILCEHVWVCSGCDVIAIHDVTDREMETICSINANSLDSYIVTYSGHHEDKTSDFETDSS